MVGIAHGPTGKSLSLGFGSSTTGLFKVPAGLGPQVWSFESDSRLGAISLVF